MGRAAGRVGGWAGRRRGRCRRPAAAARAAAAWGWGAASGAARAARAARPSRPALPVARLIVVTRSVRLTPNRPAPQMLPDLLAAARPAGAGASLRRGSSAATSGGGAFLGSGGLDGGGDGNGPDVVALPSRPAAAAVTGGLEDADGVPHELLHTRGLLAWARGDRGGALPLLERAAQLRMAEAEQRPLGLELFASLDAAASLGAARALVAAHGADPRQPGEAPSPALGAAVRCARAGARPGLPPSLLASKPAPLGRARPPWLPAEPPRSRRPARLNPAPGVHPLPRSTLQNPRGARPLRRPPARGAASVRPRAVPRRAPRRGGAAGRRRAARRARGAGGAPAGGGDIRPPGAPAEGRGADPLGATRRVPPAVIVPLHCTPPGAAWRAWPPPRGPAWQCPTQHAFANPQPPIALQGRADEAAAALESAAAVAPAVRDAPLYATLRAQARAPSLAPALARAQRPAAAARIGAPRRPRRRAPAPGARRARQVAAARRPRGGSPAGTPSVRPPPAVGPTPRNARHRRCSWRTAGWTTPARRAGLAAPRVSTPAPPALASRRSAGRCAWGARFVTAARCPRPQPATCGAPRPCRPLPCPSRARPSRPPARAPPLPASAPRSWRPPWPRPA
jgi:hypothetical protein